MAQDSKPAAVPSFSNDEELEALLLEGLNSGVPVKATREFWAERRAELHRKQLVERKASGSKSMSFPAQRETLMRLPTILSNKAAASL